jgi:predicted SPOUT superfamily RNA methylase MTH1
LTSMPRGTRLSVAIPASLIADTPHLREKTAKLGAIARACSIFRVDEVILYPDDSKHDQRGEMQLCEELLGFIETPPYLRKRLFQLKPSLKFTGIFPPLQTPHHDVPNSIHGIRAGDVRDGVVLSSRGGRLVVDVGLEETFGCRGNFPVGTRITVTLRDTGTDFTCEIVDRTKISIYWGYRVRQTKFRLGTLLEKERYDLTVGTSRYGTNILDVWSKFSDSLKNAGSVLVAFGSPRLGLREILNQEGKEAAGSFDFFVNTVPEQSVATVRTEEALIISLSLVNLMSQR